MNMSEPFWVFFANDWQSMLETTEIPDAIGASWDRKAAWLYWNKEGNDKMARGRKKATNDVAAKLLDVMNFLDVGYKASGDIQANTTVFYSGWAYSFDGVIAAGTPVSETFQFDGAVNTVLFKDALARVGKEMELVIRDDAAHFSSDEFSAMVPMVPLAALRPVRPDPAMAPFQQGIKFLSALELAGRAIKDSAQNVRDASIYLRGETVVATNGLVLVQAWHGNNMPTGQLFPKAFGNALKKIGREPKSFGFGNDTFTVFYDDGSFVRTQLYPADAYPAQQIESMLDPLMFAPLAVPPVKGLIPALEAVAPFVDERHGIAWFTGGAVRAGPADAPGWSASVEVKDLPDGIGAHAASILAYKDDIKTIWLGDPAERQQPRVVLFGEAFRAAVLGMVMAEPAKEEAPPAPLPPQAPSWGTGQVSETPPSPPGWGQAAPTGGAPTFAPPAEQSASAMTAPATGWGQPALGNVEASPSDPLASSASGAPQPEAHAASAAAQWPAPVPATAPVSHSEEAPSWYMAPAKAPTPPEGQEPSLSGAPGWDNVRAQEQQQSGGFASPGGWGNGSFVATGE
jgi:hypothetical protein